MQPIPQLEILTEGHRVTFVFNGSDALPNEGLTIASALRIRNAWPRFRNKAASQVSRGYVLPTPCRRLVREIFIAEEVYAGAVPEVCFRLQNPGGSAIPARNDLRDRIGTLDLYAPVEHLSRGARGFALNRLPRHRDAVEHLFERIGQDPMRYRGFRCDIAYPVPLIEMMWWFRLPEPAGNRMEEKTGPA